MYAAIDKSGLDGKADAIGCSIPKPFWMRTIVVFPTVIAEDHLTG